jgi:hypothetical protein
VIAVLAGLILVAFALSLATAFVLRPIAREKVVELLEKRFDRVRLERLDIALWPDFRLIPRISATGAGLSVSLPDRADSPPFITMSEFSVEVGLLGLLRDPVRVRHLRLDELRIQIPPKRGHESGLESKKESPPVFVIEELVADGTVLRIYPRDPEKEPLQFDLHQLQVLSAGLAEPMRFDALLDNAKPPGRIDTSGTFGPLLIQDPGESPVSGKYLFADANLGDFGGIGGTLYSEGRFAGILRRLEVEGFTETPDFRLKPVGQPVHLRTDFKAVVDGTSGNTLLRPVDAVLESSRFRTQGGVTALPGGEKGKTVCLDARGAEGAIEDFLRLAMKSETPIMTGNVSFDAMILIPPGEADVVQKLVLDGEFEIRSALFPQRGVQEKVDKLSEAGTSGSAEAVASLREERVLSDIRGSFELSNGVMTLSSLGFRVPGAQVTLEGTYGLETEKMDFHGELRLDAKLSETTSGIKSFLLKLVDPLFEKDDAGAVVPVKITGTADDPSFGVEVGRVLTRKEVASPGGKRGRATIRTCADVLPGDLRETSPERPRSRRGSPEKIGSR